MPKIVNSDKKIDFICEKAYEEFIKNGVNNFSLNKFIESLNMSKGQFYYYFKTKEELIFEVIDRKSEKFFEETETKISEAQTFYDKLLALFSFYLDSAAPENIPFDKLMKDTFSMYLNVENEFIKQKNAEFYDLVENAAEQARKAFDEPDNSTSISYWRELFGNEFPSPTVPPKQNNNFTERKSLTKDIGSARFG